MQPKLVTGTELIFRVPEIASHKHLPRGTMLAKTVPPKRGAPEQSKDDLHSPVLRGLLITLPSSLILWAGLVFLYLS